MPQLAHFKDRQYPPIKKVTTIIGINKYSVTYIAPKPKIVALTSHIINAILNLPLMPIQLPFSRKELVPIV